MMMIFYTWLFQNRAFLVILQMKQTYSYNLRRHRLETKQPLQTSPTRHILTHPSSPNHNISPNNQKPNKNIKTSPSSRIVKYTQSPRYKIIVAPKSWSLKQYSKKQSNRKDYPTQCRSSHFATTAKSQTNVSLSSRPLIKHTWKEVFDEQKSYMDKLDKLRRESKLNKLPKDSRSSIRYNTPPSIKQGIRPKPQPIQLKGRLLDSYKVFICSKGEARYSVGFNFNYLRNLSREEIEKCINFNDFGIVESLQLCCLDVLQLGSSRIVQAQNNLLKEYCVLYFKQFQKNLIELVLLYHYYKSHQHNLFIFFLNSRIYFYALHQISLQYLAVDSQYMPLLVKILKELIAIQRLILNGRKELFVGQKGNVNETLKLLRITNEIQKFLPTFLQGVQQLMDKAKNIGKLSTFLRELGKEPSQNMPDNIYQSLIQSEVCLSWDYLSVPPIPHLPPPQKIFTLVVGIEGVLVHYDEETKYLTLRPYLQHFFHKLEPQFQIVAFSIYEKIVADQMIDGLEKNQCRFDYRLYKEHLSLKDGSLTKDITKLGRETQRILLIDVDQVAPGVCKITKFTGNKKDKSLLTLADRLRVFVKESASDISTLGSIFCSLEDIQQENEQNANSLTVSVKNGSKKEFQDE